MSIERLDRVLNELLDAANRRPDLQEFITQPVDTEILEQIQQQAAPWLFPEEILHMARRTGFLPGQYGWSSWADLDFFPDPPAPTPGELSWERRVQEIFERTTPGREPTIHWAMIGADPDNEYDCVVPLLREEYVDAPLCFSNGIDGMEVVSPSLTVFLESFQLCMNTFTSMLGEENVEFPDFDSGYDFSWWNAIHRFHIEDDAMRAALEGPLARLNAVDQGDHPVWLSLQGSDGVSFNDERLLWLESK